MASSCSSSITKLILFSFQFSSKNSQNFTKPFVLSSPFKKQHRHCFTVSCINVSKEDTEPFTTTTADNSNQVDVVEQGEGDGSMKGKENKNVDDKFDKRRLEEKFAVLNTGIYECRSCGYRYNEAVGDPSYPIPPGFSFGKLPDDWRCPTCGAAQSFFESKSVEIAGFAENQQFGFGGNTLTAGQKALLIYGSLFLGFLLFLSGYFLQ